MAFFEKNPFGQYLFFKRLIFKYMGRVSYRRYAKVNHLEITNSKILRELPERNVLFISNHQTYFADVTAMFHVFFATLNGATDSIEDRKYLRNTKNNLYYIAARETMRSGPLAKLLSYAGAVTIDRTWRAKNESVNRQVKMSDISNIAKAIDDGWVVTFPQGTTKPWMPIRKGTAHIIKQCKPVVVPVVINGFRRAFDKKGLFYKKKGTNLSLKFKAPMEIDYENETIEQIVTKIEWAIEQHPSFNWKNKKEE